MVNPYVPLAAPQISNALVDYSPINNAMNAITAQNNQDRQFGLQQQASNRADQELALNKQTTAAALKTQAAQYEQLTHSILASTAQGALSVQDPNAQAAIANGIVSGHPEMGAKLSQYGVDPKNPVGVLNFFANYGQSPLDIQAKKAGIASTESTTALNAQKMQLAKRQFEFTSGLINAANGQPGTRAPAAQPTAAPIPGARQARDGNFYVPDPNRPGKYLMVQP